MLNDVVDSDLIEVFYKKADQIFKPLCACKLWFAMETELANARGNITVRELLDRLTEWERINLMEVLKCM